VSDRGSTRERQEPASPRDDMAALLSRALQVAKRRRRFRIGAALIVIATVVVALLLYR
jgi:hypothetical protein